MGKSIAIRSAFVLAAAAFTTFVSATAGLEVSNVSVSGKQISVAVHNTLSVDEAARIQVTVGEAGGVIETLQSPVITFVAGNTKTVTLTASQTITGVIDDPEPLPGN